jgi:hypothetical protein
MSGLSLRDFSFYFLPSPPPNPAILGEYSILEEKKL